MDESPTNQKVYTDDKGHIVTVTVDHKPGDEENPSDETPPDDNKVLHDYSDIEKYAEHFAKKKRTTQIIEKEEKELVKEKRRKISVRDESTRESSQSGGSKNEKSSGEKYIFGFIDFLFGEIGLKSKEAGPSFTKQEKEQMKEKD